MKKFTQVFKGFEELFNLFGEWHIFTIFVLACGGYLLLFYILMIGNRQSIDKKGHSQTLFFSILVFYIIVIVLSLIVLSNLFLYHNQSVYSPYLVNNGFKSMVFNGVIVLLNIFFIYMVITLFKPKTRAYRAKQIKDFSFSIQERFKKVIDNKDMQDMGDIYTINSKGKKEYLNNYYVPKLTRFNKNIKLRPFQRELLNYLLNYTKQEHTQGKFFEFEILRLIEITIEKKLDLKLGQFRMICEYREDLELLGAIFNLRENNITKEGYCYYTQYIEAKGAKNGAN